jgi:hypothetical protein
MIIILEPILDNDNNKITYPIIINEIKYDFYIKYRNKSIINTNIDGIVPMFISIAICNKWKIKSNLPIDYKLYNNLLNIENTYKKYHHIHTYLMKNISQEEIKLLLDIPVCNRTYSNNIIITPISMGIDSIHTISNNINLITHLIYIIDLDMSSYIKNFINIIINTANHFKKEVIIAESNFKEMFYNIKADGTHYGVFLGDSILLASCYSLGIKTIYYSGNGGDIKCLNGQHSEVNKYYVGNEFNSIQNNTLRIIKIKKIVENQPELLSQIRVCNEDTSLMKTLNCSKCNKCAETLCYFYMLGYIKNAISFKYDIDINYLSYYLDKYYNNKHKLLFEVLEQKKFKALYDIYINNNNSIIDIINNLQIDI